MTDSDSTTVPESTATPPKQLRQRLEALPPELYDQVRSEVFRAPGYTIHNFTGYPLDIEEVEIATPGEHRECLKLLQISDATRYDFEDQYYRQGSNFVFTLSSFKTFYETYFHFSPDLIEHKYITVLFPECTDDCFTTWLSDYRSTWTCPHSISASEFRSCYNAAHKCVNAGNIKAHLEDWRDKKGALAKSRARGAYWRFAPKT